MEKVFVDGKEGIKIANQLVCISHKPDLIFFDVLIKTENDVKWDDLKKNWESLVGKRGAVIFIPDEIE